jgi:hypothetical protein
MFNGVPSFGYERIITKEEASKMIWNFVKNVLNNQPIRKSTDRLCKFTDLQWADPTLVFYIRQSCLYGIFDTKLQKEFMSLQNLSHANTIVTILRWVYWYMDETKNPRFLSYIDLIQSKKIQWSWFKLPKDLSIWEYQGMQRGNLWELMYRAAIDIFNKK